MKISLYLTPEEYVAINKYADSQDSSVSYVVRLAIRKTVGLPTKRSGKVGQHDPLSHLRDRYDID